MKKCPNCGNNSPQENNTCNHCGYSFKGSNGTSFTSVRGGNNSSSYENFRSDLFGKLGSSSQKINNFFRSFFVIVFVIVIITFISSGYIIFNISNEINENINNFDDNIYTCEFLCNDSLYVEFYNKCVCNNDNIYDKETGEIIYDSSIDMSFDSDALAKCKLYCGEPVVNYNSDTCHCSDGKLYNFSGVEVFEEIPNYRTVDEWYSDVKSGDTVITVLCENNKSKCLSFKYNMDDLAIKYNLDYYYFNLDLLDEEDKSVLLDTYFLQLYEMTQSVPYAFVVKDDEFKYQSIHTADTNGIEEFLLDEGIVK